MSPTDPYRGDHFDVYDEGGHPRPIGAYRYYTEFEDHDAPCQWGCPTCARRGDAIRRWHEENPPPNGPVCMCGLPTWCEMHDVYGDPEVPVLRRSSGDEHGPVLPSESGGGPDGWLITHHSVDGRERAER